MEEVFDKIDRQILENVETFSGSQLSTISESCQRETGLKDSAIRHRIDRLDVLGAVLEDRAKSRGKVFVTITGYGRDVLKEGRKTAQPKGAGQHD